MVRFVTSLLILGSGPFREAGPAIPNISVWVDFPLFRYISYEKSYYLLRTTKSMTTEEPDLEASAHPATCDPKRHRFPGGYGGEIRTYRVHIRLYKDV